MAVAARATAAEAQAALVEGTRVGIGTVEGSAPRSAAYVNQFGPQTRPSANPRANWEAASISADIRALQGVPESTPAVELDSGAAYLFRSDPGHRECCFRLPGVPQCRNREHQEWHQRVYERKYSPEQRALHERLAQQNGGLTVTFTVVARKQESYLELEEWQAELAGYIRGEIAGGRLPMVYEDVPKHKVEKTTQPTHREQAAMRMRLAGGEGTGQRSTEVDVFGGAEYDTPPAPKPKRKRAAPKNPPPRDPVTGRLLPRSAAPAPAGD